MDLSRVDIVLVRPARPANVGAACRAMKNMGLRTLWLVLPPPALVAPEGLEPEEARALAHGAWDVLERARRVGSLEEAVAGSVLVAGTTGRSLGTACTPRALAAEAQRRCGGGRLSVVFGPEATGLSRRELALCHVLVHVPTDPEHPSLNLAQAVLLLAYELRLAALDDTGAGEGGGSGPAEAPAPASELERALLDLRGALLEIGYLDPASPDHILTELRRLLARAGPTPREVLLLRGLARQMAWAGRVARGGSGSR
jgi:TrmH family RNA methyltransferase